ncbi:PKD domain-containing protein [Pyxidicoccus caerfyrddinensis]|uniref:PKD domain-containing protein n=1 Tax=Pyxidicoccus caerfyrddinensis TaxID=2709663 RepID=UPI0013D98138|nr:PKD domain-containing protein [Pyxidicoccus caerfyrddinensis]
MAPSDEAPRPAVQLEGQGLNCGETYALVITQPDGTSTSESLTADTLGKVQSTSIPDAHSGNKQARLYDSSGDEVAQTLYYEPVFRYGHLTWRTVGPRTAEFSVVNAFRRVYWGSGPDGLVVTGDTFQEYAGSTSLCFGDGTCTYALTYEVTDYDAEEGWVTARAFAPSEPQVLPGTGVTVTESEPNNGIDTTDSLQLGDDYSSNISVPYERDYVRFTLTERTRIEVRTVLQGLRDSYLYLFDANGVHLASDDDSGGGLASRISITLDAGTYYVAASAFGAGTGQQFVQFRRVAIPPPGPITHTYGWDGPFTASISGCCRIEGLDNLAGPWSPSYRVQTQVGFTPANSAPVSSLPPVIEAPANMPDFAFQIPATDADGDELTFRLATDSESFIVNPPPGLSVSSTGVVSWNTVGTVGGQQWVVQVIIEEHRDGARIGSSAVDFLLKSTGDTGTAPTCLPPSQTDYTVMPGERVEFSLGAQDADTWDLLTLNAINVPWGAFLLPSLPLRGYSGISTTFFWTPSSWDVGATYPMRFTVTDSTGQQAGCSVTITVQNRSNWPPQAYAGSDQGGFEGQTVTLSGSGYDPDGNPLTYSWSLVSATGPAVTLSSADSPTPSFMATDDGVYTFQLTVTDSLGASDSDSVTVYVYNEAPQVIAPGSAQLDEGQVFTAAGSITDPGADSWTATVDYDDGTGPHPLVLDNGTFTLSHRYPDDRDDWWSDSYYVRISVTDDDGGEDTVYVAVHVLNVAPVITAYPPGITLDEGQAAVVPITFTDPGADSWTLSVDYGDGYSDGVWTSSQEHTFQHVYYWPGTYSLRLWVWDGDGGQHEVTIPVVVRNLAPVVSVEGGTIDEGSFFFSFGSVSDLDDCWANCTITVDYGDGTGVQGIPLPYYDNRFYFGHTYADSGTYLLTVTVRDGLGAEGRATATVVVNNVAPQVYLEEPYYVFPEGSSLSLWGYVSDPGSQDSLTATVDFGDGTGPQPLQLTGQYLTLGHEFANNGTFTVTLTVMDDNGGVGTATSRVSIYNVPPTVSATGGSVDEGSTFSSSGSFTDPGADTWTARVDYGDGSGWQPLALNGKSFALEHAYASSGMYPVEIIVRDSDGAEGWSVVYATVLNVVPTVTVTGSGPLNEGSTFTASGSFTDPGDEFGWMAYVDYGDGNYEWEQLPLDGRSFSLSHIYGESGTYTVTVYVFDGGGVGIGSTQVGVVNVAPVVTATGGTADEGAYLSMSALITDPSFSDTLVAMIDYGDGSPVERRPLNWLRNFIPFHLYADDGTYQVTITVTDDDGGTGTVTVPVHVRNVAPTMVAFLSDSDITEGFLFTGRGQFYEQGADTVTFTVDFGDGSAPVQFLPNPGAPNTFNAPHVYADSGTYRLTVTLTDDDGGASTFTAQAAILNVAPTVTASNDSPAYWGTPVNLVGTATDPSPVDTEAGFTPLWTLGDDTMAAGLTTAHTYAAPGTYPARLRVTDKDGGSNTAMTTVSIQQRPGAVTCSDTTAVFGFPAALGASFVDGLAGGLPGGRSLGFRLGGSTVLGSATTDASGLASVRSPGSLMPGSYSFTVSFAGDSHYTAAEAHCTLTVTESNGRITGGDLGFSSRARGGFNVARMEGGPARGELQFQNDTTSFHAHELTALGVSADKRQGWFAGVGRDGRAFTAYVEDNGEPFTGDVFKLWIDGVLQTANGGLSGGNIQIH